MSLYIRSKNNRRKYIITPCTSLDPAYLIGKWVDQEREKEHSGHFVCRGPEEKRIEEKEERYYEEVHSRNFVTLLLNIIKTKFIWT